MKNLEIYNIIISNPIYLSIAVILSLLLIYSALKKFIKLIIVVFFCIVLYLGYLYLSGDASTVEDINKIKESVKDSKGYLEEKIKNNFNDK